MSEKARSTRAVSPACAARSTSSYSAEACAAWVRCQYCQPFQAAKAPKTTISDPGDQVAVLVPEMLELVKLFLFFEVEMFCHAVCPSAMGAVAIVVEPVPSPGQDRPRASGRAADLRAAAVAQRFDRHFALRQFVGAEDQRIRARRWRRPS